MWKKNNYSKRQINDAGMKIITPGIPVEDYNSALDIIDNWRTAHAFPMNTFAVNLRRKVADMNGAVVVQRLKRLDTICGKLLRYPDMKLYRMQDLGGCRVIVPTVDDVYVVKERLEKSRIRHEPRVPKDYIKIPNANTGYRGVHLIYKYRSEKTSDYNGMLIEIQIRTKLQHLWATAVETVGVFTDNGLKFNQGSEKWLEFFKLVSAIFSIEEETPIVAGVPQDIFGLIERILELDSELGALDKMHTIGVITKNFGHLHKKIKSGYYLLKLDLNAAQISVYFFEGGERGLDAASAAYNEAEKSKGEKTDVVLVSAQSYEALVNAYPNYFANIREFRETLLLIIGKNIDKIRSEKQSQIPVSV